MDLTIPITGGTVLFVIIALVGYFGKEKLAEMRERRLAFEAHIAFCGKKTVTDALLESRVTLIEQQMESDRHARHWLGDCMMTIGGKMNVQLPPRPE